MKSPFARIIVAIASTTLLHASIFYTLKETKKSDIIKFKTTEIALVDAYIPQKKEPAVKEILKPKEKPKVIKIEKPKPIPSLESKKIPKKIMKKESKEPALEEKTEKDLVHTATKDAATTFLKSASKEPAINPSELNQYLYEIRGKIQKNLKYPSTARKLRIEGESTVNFEILNDGKVNSSSIKLVKSSGHKALDDEALEAILRVLPFSPPPKNRMSVTVPIAFNLR